MVILYARVYTYFIIYYFMRNMVYDNNIDNNNVTIYATPVFIIRIGGAVVITIVGTVWVDQWCATNYLVNIPLSDVYHGNPR